MKTPFLAPSLLLIFTTTVAYGGDYWHAGQAHDRNWKCKYCVFEDSSDNEVGLSYGYLDGNDYRFGHLSGIDDGSNVSASFNFDHKNAENSERWRLSLDSQSVDAKTITADWRQSNHWHVRGRYQDFPIRQYEGLYSPYTTSGSTLTLPDSWSYPDTMQPLPYGGTRTTMLGSDWRRLDLGLDLTHNDIDYAIAYSRIERSGTLAASTAQILNAFYLPLPMDTSVDNLGLSLTGQWQQLVYKLAYAVSKFDNSYDSYRFDIPYQPLLPTATTGELSAEPDNIAYKVSGTLQLRLEDSHIKGYFAFGKQKQDQTLSPYSTNPALNPLLPVQAPNLEVATRHFDLRYDKKFSRRFSVTGKYNFRQRDNRSEQWLFTPVINDVYVAGDTANILYDNTKRKLSFNAKWRFDAGRFASLQWSEHRKRRHYEIDTKTRDAGLDAKVYLPFSDNSLLQLEGQRFNRKGSQWQVIDLVETQIDPLLQKFTEADRKQRKYAVDYSRPIGNFNLHLNTERLESDYTNSTLGLNESTSKQYGVAVDWAWNATTALSAFAHRQQIESDYSGQNSVASAIWRGTSEDHLNGYGFNLRARELFERPIELKLKWYKSRGESDLYTISSLAQNTLPQVLSHWTSAELDLKYRFENHWSARFGYRHDRFASSDYALDLSQPGAVRNLLTFGALSHNYRINYFVFAVNYRF